MERPPARAWLAEAMRLVEADANRSADTHLHVFPLPRHWNIDLYLKDESVHPTGSLKHRLARSLFLYGLANGWITEGKTIVEASSGSTAISEAYFARLLGLPFIAVVPSHTSAQKLTLIESYGGRCHFAVDPGNIYEEARILAKSINGHYMDQFVYAERATDWRGNNNIAESILDQMRFERYPVPTCVVVGAGTGGTSATLGRYLRYKRLPTDLCVVDPEGSAFYEAWTTGDATVRGVGSRVEGIGRPRVEPSFLPSVVDRMIRVPDAASIGAMRITGRLIGKVVGGSTGTNVWGALTVISEMLAVGAQGSVVTLICDGGERYRDTFYSDEWLLRQDISPGAFETRIERFLTSASGDPTRMVLQPPGEPR